MLIVLASNTTSDVKSNLCDNLKHVDCILLLRLQGARPRHQGRAHGGRAPAKITGLFVLKKSKKWQPCVVCSMEAGADG